MKETRKEVRREEKRKGEEDRTLGLTKFQRRD
jgi:hypothetical protein